MLESFKAYGMRHLILSVVVLISLTACKEFTKDVSESSEQLAKNAGTVVKDAARAVGDAGNELAKSIKQTIQDNTD